VREKLEVRPAVEEAEGKCRREGRRVKRGRE
jgi:hypothetical protein